MLRKRPFRERETYMPAGGRNQEQIIFPIVQKVSDILRQLLKIYDIILLELLVFLEGVAKECMMF